MNGPDLRRLIRSLRTKSYDKIQIQKYYIAFSERRKSEEGGLSSEEEFDNWKESHRKVDNNKNAFRDHRR